MALTLASDAFEVADIDEFTELAYQRGWTDGLPVLPPTEQRVAAILDYLGQDPARVVGVLSPGEGLATIEKIAINCAMAGCRPEYVPVVIAAIEAMLEPEFELMRVQCTTGGPIPMAIISGPVVEKLGLNYGEGAFAGTGNRANSTIGRAIRLVLWNVSLARPGELCHATMGHPGWYSYLVAERPPSDSNPWEPFHVTEAGLRPEDSAISMFPAAGHEQIYAGVGQQTLENNLYVIADSMFHLGNFQGATQKLFVINPQAANVFADEGWSKQRLRDALLKRCRRPVSEISRTGGISTTAEYHWTKLVDPDDEDAMVPSLIGPHHLPILVSGGWAPPVSQCCIIPSLHGEMVTKKIDWNWD